jgi:hypothetical protein
MSRHRKAQILTLAVLLAALGGGLARTKGWRWSSLSSARASIEATPQDAIYAMLNAARAGDVKTYLASFAGPMQASLRQAVAEQTEPGFAKYLLDSTSSVKGVAVSDPEAITGSTARVRVEYVYQDRNEAQVFDMEKIQREWKIAGMGSGERVKTLIPYGTPVK